MHCCQTVRTERVGIQLLDCRGKGSADFPATQPRRRTPHLRTAACHAPRAAAMLQNAGTTLLSPCGTLRLDPYTRAHVPAYHAWMTSPALLAATGSEPLTLAEEAASCAAWRADPDKLTFLLAQPAARRVVGDVNVLFGPPGEDAAAAELDVMVALPAARRQGLASAALRAAMAYALCASGRRVDVFVAKIKAGNAPSVALFRALGFRELRVVPAFAEVHYCLHVAADVRAELEEMWRQWEVRDYADVDPFLE